MNKYERILDNVAGGLLVAVLLGIIGMSIFVGLTGYEKSETVPIKLVCTDRQVEPNEPCNYTFLTELNVENGGIRPFRIYCPKCFSELDWYIKGEEESDES